MGSIIIASFEFFCFFLAKIIPRPPTSRRTKYLLLLWLLYGCCQHFNVMPSPLFKCSDDRSKMEQKESSRGWYLSQVKWKICLYWQMSQIYAARPMRNSYCDSFVPENSRSTVHLNWWVFQWNVHFFLLSYPVSIRVSVCSFLFLMVMSIAGNMIMMEMEHVEFRSEA